MNAKKPGPAQTNYMKEKNQTERQHKKDKVGKKKNTLKELWKQLQPFKFYIALLFVLGAIANGTALLIPRTIGDAIDNHELDNFSSSDTLTFLLVVVFVALAASIAQQIVSIHVSEKLAYSLRTSLARSISKQSHEFVQQQSAAKLLTNFTSDVDEVKVVISQGMVTLLSAIIMVVGSAAFLFSINARLSFAALATLPVLFILFQVVMRKIRSIFKEARENTDFLNRVITESIVGSMLVRVLAAQPAQNKTFDVTNTTARQIGYRLLATFGSFFPMLNLLSSASIVIVVWYGGWQVMDGQMSLGDFTAFNSYLLGLITPIFIFGFVSNIFVRASVAFGRMQAVLTAETPKLGGAAKPELNNQIELQDLSLTLEGRPILKALNLEIPFGKYTAIIGPTAAGKTHLLLILLGMVEPTSGTIKINGVDFSNIDRDAWLSKCGIVFQDHVIFQGSIKENITLGRDVTDEQIKQSIELADLTAFVEGLPEGLETDVSERGSNLSGGQKQRVGLARAILENPDILILDDFTARVDRATDARIREKLEQAIKNQTRIVISQTIDSVKDADHIILLMEGELIAQGKHDQLIKNSFEYQQIAESQKTTEL